MWTALIHLGKKMDASLKRAMDVALVLTLAPVALGVCGLAALLIRLESPGSPLFKQTRVGRGQAPFTCYKLRTMRLDTAHVGSHEVDPGQLTRVGRQLRRLKIDELPQLINVLRGEMSFVGPRPCLPGMHELIEARERLGVYTVRPGITGPAQLAKIDMSTPQALAAEDARYLQSASTVYDIRVLVMTFLGRGSGDGARVDRKVTQ